ncbi:MAG: T9SS type A sorting domain-containing protein [Saprospiraceae bacterium]|nr:T9SS type A sorting domain-containing protein [Saprospiraceae bacterium]
MVWNTENEVRTKKYIIERSLDGEQFSEIGTVNSLSFSINHYNFIDKSPFVGNNYYRICELDENGLKSYTNIIVINNSAPIKIEVYPNILNRNEQINIIVPNNEPFTIKVFDAKAVQVYYQEFTGQQNLPMNLSSGIYFYIIESKSNMLNGKLVIR